MSFCQVKDTFFSIKTTPGVSDPENLCEQKNWPDPIKIRKKEKAPVLQIKVLEARFLIFDSAKISQDIFDETRHRVTFLGSKT